MQTVKTDEKRRVVLLGAKPAQTFTYRETPEGVIVLTPIERADPDMRAVIADTWEKLGPPPGVDYGKLESR
jgi:hypothetical protein